MTGSLTLVVQLYLAQERQAEYESFEAAASRIMQRYGGRIERRIEVLAGGTSAETGPTPDEIHVVTFPSQERFDEYARDPELTELREQRNRAVRSTVIWHGTDLPLFG